jgi:hypothetical protein
MPEQTLYWQIESFLTCTMAESAKEPSKTLVEAID